MEAHAWKFNGITEMSFVTRLSSEGRRWTGFDARIYDTSGGFAAKSGGPRHCVVMQVRGVINALCRCDGMVQRRRAIRGDIDILPSTVSVSWEEDGPTMMLAIGVTPSLVRLVAQDMDLDPDRVSIAPQLQLRDPKIEHIGWALVAELQAPEPSGRLYADSLGLALAAQLLQRHTPAIPPRLRRGFSKNRLRDVIDYIHDNLTLDLSLPELAAVAGLSTSHFKALFKEATNLPVHQYVIQCRVEHAVNLLVHGNTSLSEVASLAGFSDQSHMARCMRRFMGVTPAEVRRQHE